MTVSTVDYFLQLAVENTCATTCNAGEYKDVTHLKCKACNFACAACTAYSTCQSCQAVNGVAYFLSSATCTVLCPTNQYGKVASYTC
jgi:hypothetical protein